MAPFGGGKHAFLLMLEMHPQLRLSGGRSRLYALV